MIRPATAGDAPRVIAMAQRFLETFTPGDVMEPQPYALEALFSVAFDNGVILVHEAPDGRLNAFLALVGPLPHQISGESYADELAWWVEPEARGLGIGELLLAQAERWGRAHAICVLKMLAPAGSSIGDLYRKQGYVAVETAYMKRL